MDSLRATLVFDAQTSGGLVLAVPQERVEEALERLPLSVSPDGLLGTFCLSETVLSFS